MRVLGIDLIGNDANVVLLEYTNGMFFFPDCRARKITCHNPDKASELKYFQKSVAKLVEDYGVEEIIIKDRMKKGRFAGGANGFKLEAAIQLMTACEVHIMQTVTMNAVLKKYPILFSFAETGLKKFQENAFNVAYAYLSDPNGKVEENRLKTIQHRKRQREAEEFEYDDED